MQSKIHNSRALLGACAGACLLLLVAWFVRPNVTPGHDAPFYLEMMGQFLQAGWNFPYAREPLYPCFLALLKTCGLPPVQYAPLVQNVLFVAALYFFLRSLLRQTLSRMRTLCFAVALTLLPTFCIVMNGALYTEALAAVLILLLLSSYFRLRACCERMFGGGALVWLAAGLASSAALGLLKGSFVFIHYLFALAGLLGLALEWRRAKPARRRRGALCVLAAWFLLVGVGSKLGAEFWFAHVATLTGKPCRLYERGGLLLYSRTAYAENFAFTSQSLPYLLNAFSESAGRRWYGAHNRAYAFDSEIALGQAQQAAGSSEDELFAAGLRNLLHSPVRQGVFAFFELSRLVFHHGARGFAALRLPAANAVLYSTPFILALKLFNLALFLLIPIYVCRRLRRAAPGEIWRALPAGTRAGLAIYPLYACAYLAVYGFTVTVVRMAYPLAPFLIILNWQVVSALRKQLRV